jgi:hypothetical protein
LCYPIAGFNDDLRSCTVIRAHAAWRDAVIV